MLDGGPPAFNTAGAGPGPPGILRTVDRRDLGLGLALGLGSFALFRATEQVLLFHDAVFFRRILEEGRWGYSHLLWLPTLQVLRWGTEAAGIEVESRDLLFFVSAASGGAIVASSFAIARALLSRMAATLLSLLLVATPAVWFQASSACIHAFHGAFAAAAFALVYRLRPGDGVGRRLGAGTAMALLPASHLAGAFLVPGYLAFAAWRGGRVRRDPLRRGLPLLAPSLLGLGVVVWLTASARSGRGGLPVEKVVRAALASPLAYLPEGIAQAARSMPFLGGLGLLGWAAGSSRRKGLLPFLLVLVPLFLGVSLWVQDLTGAYYLGATGVLCVGAARAWRFLARLGSGRAVASAALAACVAAQTGLSLPERIREADARTHLERMEELFRTGALLLYEPSVPLSVAFQDAAKGRLVLNLYFLDAFPANGTGGATEWLERETAALRGREVVLDRRVYEAVRRGSRSAEWFEGFRKGFRGERLPGRPEFEILRPIRDG